MSRADLDNDVAKRIKSWNINPSDEHQFESEFKYDKFLIGDAEYKFCQLYKYLKENSQLRKMHYIPPGISDERALFRMEDDSLIATEFGIGTCTEKSGFAR